MVRFGYLKTCNGVRRREIPRGCASVRATHFGCDFHPEIMPGEAVEHDCPVGPDAEEWKELQHARSLLRTLGVRRNDPRWAIIDARLDELRPGLEARANRPWTLPEDAEGIQWNTDARLF